jgi:hypothetical protein
MSAQTKEEWHQKLGAYILKSKELVASVFANRAGIL